VEEDLDLVALVQIEGYGEEVEGHEEDQIDHIDHHEKEAVDHESPVLHIRHGLKITKLQ
jgi:hypothetical protein